ncbi:MAG: hypothetical protein K2O20_07590, partial [Duncaniella sp.]|nr:hypothetical protein [Duncaniella sp.]
NGSNVWQNYLPFFVSAGQSTTVTISASLPGAKPGETYEVRCCRNVGGSYKYKTESVYFTIGSRSGIGGIEADDSAAPAEYFNLNGLRVDASRLLPGVYIRRQAGKVTKVLVR